AERHDSESILNLYRRLIVTRRQRRSLQLGGYRPIRATGHLLLFARESPGERTLVGLNFGGEALTVTFAHGLRGEVLASSGGDRDRTLIEGDLALQGNEGIVVALAPEIELPRSV